MEYIIIGMLGLIIILLIILLLKKNDHDTSDRISKLELNVVKEIGDFKVDFTNNNL